MNTLNTLFQGLGSVKMPDTVLPPIPLTIVPMAEGYDYKPYQRDALEHLFRDPSKPYGYCALDMGLGKTPVGLGVAAAATAAGVRPTLIVVPPSLRTNWQREARKFFPHLTVAVLHGRGPVGTTEVPDADVLIMGDSSLSGQGKVRKEDDVKATWVRVLAGNIGALVIDEAHRFKNKSNRSDALITLATGIERIKDKQGKVRRVPLTRLDGTLASTPTIRVPMSGTPVPNGRNMELAQQVSIMGSDAWKDIGGEGQFWHHYCPKVDEFSRVNANTDELNEVMANTWFFRRLRDDVEDLPNKGRSGVSFEGKGPAVREYLKAEADLFEYLQEKNGKVTAGQQRAEAIVKLNTLRKLAGTCKVAAVVEHVKDLLDENDGGVFIVAEHNDVMDGLIMGLLKYNPTCVRGGMSDKVKDQEINLFLSGESRVLIGQITAAGVGLTLHGEGRNRRVVVAQLPWTPAELKQAEDRLHRLGQTRDVYVEVALAAIDGSWTIDERLWSTLEGKNFASTTLTDGEGEYLLTSVQETILEGYRQ